jgi:hypothetical protein
MSVNQEVTSVAAPVASGWNGCRWDLHALESAVSTAHTRSGHASRRNKRAKAANVLPPPGREIVAFGIASFFPDAAFAKAKLMLRIHERR